MNYSILILSIAFAIFLIIKIIIVRRKLKGKKRKKFLDYAEISDILMDSAMFMAGLIAFALALDLEVALMGKDISYTQPFVNYVAGILLITSAIIHLFKGGKK